MMKRFMYSLCALIFNLFAALRRPDRNTIAFVSMHNENFNDSLGAVYDVLKENKSLHFLFLSREQLKGGLSAVGFFAGVARLPRAGTILLNDNFLPMGRMRIKNEVKVVQLWHAEGAFKKFGFAIDQPEEVRKAELSAAEKLTHVVCSGKAVASIYAEAFGVHSDCVLPLGSPRTDFFFDGEKCAAARRKLEEAFPSFKGKKVVLYAPTFRGDGQQDREILSHFDFERFEKELGGEYALCVRLHPQIHSSFTLPQNVADLTLYPDVRELCAACDVCITDYSSICMAFSLMDKPTIFYAYDLVDYKGARDFYFDYASYVPGPVVSDMNGLVSAIGNPFDAEKNERFKKFNFDHFDGRSAERVAGMILK